MTRALPTSPALPGFAQTKTYAAWRVWKGSTTAELKSVPLTREEAWRLYDDANLFEEQTRGRHASHYVKGKISAREGVLGRSALDVLRVLTFKFRNRRTGRIDPCYKSIARKAHMSVATVGRALARLKSAGVLHWVQRARPEENEEGGFLLRQISNLYGLVPSASWRGFRRPPDPPPPDPQTWGKTAPMGFAEAQAIGAGDAWLELGGGPAPRLSEALARLSKGRKP